jgi:pimeloyl-ACP methyl ester carboxylesterase
MTCTLVDSGTSSPFLDDGGADARRVATLFDDAPRPLLSKESVRWVTVMHSFADDHTTEEWLNKRIEIAELPKNAEAVAKMGGASDDLLLTRQFLPRLTQQKDETHEWLREGRLTIPTLLIWGRNDPTAVLERGLALYKLLAASAKRAEMHVFNEAGHYTYREHPSEFVSVVTDFVRRESS